MSELYSDERWLPAVGYEGFYEVSDCGRVRSLDRRIARKSGASTVLRGRLLRQGSYSNGYLFVCLHMNGSHRSESVHRLVAKAFFPNADADSLQVNHKDGDRRNNCAFNLEWVTCSENHAHAHKLPWRKLHGNAVRICAALDIGPAVFESAKAACRYLNSRGMAVNHGSVLSSANRNHRCVGFFFWRVQ